MRSKDGGQKSSVVNGVIRHYNQAGKSLGEFLPQSTFTLNEMARFTPGLLVPNGKGVTWHPHFSDKFLEVLPDGEVRTLPGVPRRSRATWVYGLAVTSSGDVLASTNEFPGGFLYHFNRNEKQWRSIDVNGLTYVHGALGNRLVLARGSRFAEAQLFDVGSESPF